MTRRFRFLISLIVLHVAATFVRAEPANRPNILLILADDVGQEVLGCYGGLSYQTPNIDALAKTGMRFLHCYSMPVCHPTRVTLLTGRYPFRLGRPSWGSFPEAEQGGTFAHVMKHAGYATAVAGKWQLVLMKRDPEHPHRLGFDHYSLFGWHEGPRYYDPLVYQNGKARDDTKGKYGPELYTDFLIDFMRGNRDRPFVAFYSMALAHDVTDDLKEAVPFGPGKDRYDSYAEMIASMDRMVGKVVTAVDDLGLREKTLILFTTDNGTPKRSIAGVRNGKLYREPVSSKLSDQVLPGGKGELTDLGTRVPLIANWRGTTPPGKVVDDLVDFSDFLPTFAELGGAKLPKGVKPDGVSFAVRLRRGTGNGRPWVYAEDGKRFFVRTQRWKLYSDGELYDMKSDPRETKPIAQHAESAQATMVRRKLQAAIASLKAGR